MSNINVLSDSFRGRTNVESSSVGKVSTESSANAAALFASFLGDFIKPNVDPKGQNSKDGQNGEEQQSVGNPIQNVEDSNGLGMLGYGNFAWLFQSLPMFQSDNPAGKEANSGESMSQGIVNSSLDNPDLMNLISLNSEEGNGLKRMSTLYSQGDNLGITELDKYRQVISNLLVELSGTITDSSQRGDLSKADTSGIKDLQGLAMIFQGWMTATDENGEEAKNLNHDLVRVLQEWRMAADNKLNSVDVKSSFDRHALEQTQFKQLIENLAAGSSKNDSPELNTKTANLIAALFPLSAGDRGEKVSQDLKEAQLNNLKSMVVDSDTVLSKENGSELLSNSQQKSKGTDLLLRKIPEILQGSSYEDLNKTYNNKPDASGIKDVQNLSSGLGIGALTNVVPINPAEGKGVGVPAWEQISNIVREQVMTNQQTLKELDIQLHPEELGKVRILLRWESGQVHLHVQANEAATGQLLQNQLSDLRQSLMNQGVNCGSLEMGQNGERQQQSQGDDAQRAFQQDMTPSTDEEKHDAIFNDMIGDNRINVTA